MAVGRGFLVSEAHISMLKKLRPGVRSAVLGAAFARAFELNDCDAPDDEFGLLASLSEAVAADALDFDERGEELRRKSADRQRRRRGAVCESDDVTRTENTSRERETRHADAENVTRTDETGGVRVTENMSRVRETRHADAENVTRRIEENGKEEKGSVCGAHTHGQGLEPGADDAPPTAGRIAAWTAVHFSPPPPAEFIAEFHARMTEGGWRDARGRDISRRGLWQRELSAWWSVERRKATARAAADEPPASTGAGRVAVPLFDGGEAAE